MVEIFRLATRTCLATIAAFVVVPETSFAFESPALPQPPTTFDTPYQLPSGKRIEVPAGGNLQAALEAARGGDIVVLQAGATYRGSFTLRSKPGGDGWIYIQTSSYDQIPSSGKRVSVADLQNMATIEGVGPLPAIRTNGTASFYRFVGITIRPAPGQFVVNLIQIGDGETRASELPRYIVFDRCFVEADRRVGGRRGIAMDGTHLVVVDSHVAGFREKGADSQALWAHNTPGPLRIVNNYLEAAGENVMFGGADGHIPGVVPSDIEIRDNNFFKPLTWIGTSWTVKNLLEFKNARRVHVIQNVFENNWVASQNGFSVLITPANQDGGAPWTIVEDIAIERNRFHNLAQGINIKGRESSNPKSVTSRILIRDNLLEISGLNGANGRAIQTILGPTDITIDHNTVINSAKSGGAAILMAENEPLAERISITNNIVSRGDFGVIGTNSGEGRSTLDRHFRSWRFERNAIVGDKPSGYPEGNFFVQSIDEVNFSDPSRGDWRLSERSAFRRAALDGRDLGANFAAPQSGAQTKPNPPANLRIDP